mmetsp:Transcript_11886/g.36972  ORF Transcript_11886/g.36972 Transcript_11886/m.36972 type:complete len:287 (-) Transcript_11886:752-1612(-)
MHCTSTLQQRHSRARGPRGSRPQQRPKESNPHSSPPRAPPSGTARQLPGKCYCAFPESRGTVHVVPREDVASVPPDVEISAGPLLLCRPFADTGVCKSADSCPFTHASITRAVSHTAHTRVSRDAATEAAADEAYSRETTVVVPIAGVGEAAAPVMVRLSRCLRTLAPLEKWLSSHESAAPSSAIAQHEGVAGTLCAHWSTAGRCHFGPNCRFVHALDAPTDPSTDYDVSSLPGSGRSTDSVSTRARGADANPHGGDGLRRFPFRHQPYDAKPTVLATGEPPSIDS